MTIFSFRAECQHDIKELRKTVKNQKLDITFLEKPVLFGEVLVEVTTSLSLEEIRQAMRVQDDGHVMIQTLRQLPMAENNFARDYDID